MRQGRLIGIEPDDAENILVCSICKSLYHRAGYEQCQKALSGDSSLGLSEKMIKCVWKNLKLRTDDKTVKEQRTYVHDRPYP